MKLLKSLPAKLLIGLVIGIIVGLVAPAGLMTVIVTLKYIMGQVITFCVPLIVIGFIAPSITKLGSSASRMLGVALVIAYVSSICAAFMSMIAGFGLIPGLHIVSNVDSLKELPAVAFELNIPQITYVQKLDIEGDKVIVQRQLEDGYTVVEAKMPVLLTAIKELNTPRYMTPKGIFEAYNKTVQVWGFNDVPVDAEKIGLKGSPTNVNRTFSPEAKGKGIMLEGADKETVKTLIAKLDEKHLL